MLNGILHSQGLLRTVGATLAGIGAILSQVEDPQYVVIGIILLKVGGFIGGTGVVRAIATGNVPIKNEAEVSELKTSA